MRVYGSGTTAVRAIDGIDVDVAAGEFVAIMGPSGSGKSTLLHCMAGLDRLTDGSITIAGTELGGLNDKKLTLLRREQVGFVFQAYNLVPTLDAAANITLPVDLAGDKVDRDWFDQIVDVLGLRDSNSSAELLGFLRRAAREFNQTIVMVTHEPTAASYAQRILFLVDGQIIDEMHDPTADGVLERMKRLEHGPAASSASSSA